MIQKYKRYDVVLVDFKQGVGSEQSGVRPALIIQNNVGNLHSPTTIVMSFTSNINKNPNQPTHTLIKKRVDNGLKMDSLLLGEKIREVSEERIIKYLGTVKDVNDRQAIKRVYDANFGVEEDS